MPHPRHGAGGTHRQPDRRTSGVSGSGSLARIRFNATAAGTSALTFSNLLLLDSAQNDIALQVDNRSITALVPEPSAWLLLGLGLAGVAGLQTVRSRAAPR